MSEYVIIGASAAGLSCAEAIRSKDKKGRITLLSEEEVPLYSRCLLTYFISGKLDKEKLAFKEKDFYKKNGIEAHHGVKAERIDLKIRKVVCGNKKSFKFDKLLIATGARSKAAGIDGEDKRGVLGLRTIKDAEEIIGMLDKVETAVILGGGLIGLRDAYALNLRGKKVKAIVRSPQVLSQMLDKDAADIIESRLAEEGIEVMKGLSATAVKGKANAEGVKLENGDTIPCQLVIIGKGVKPNSEIASDAGIKVKEGIIVNEYLGTSIKDIYAAGDVCEAYDVAQEKSGVSAIWPVAVEQGRIAGLNMAGEKTPYDGSAMMNATDFYGLAAISIGLTKVKSQGYDELVKIDRPGKTYKKLVLKDDIMRGAILINNVQSAGVYGVLIQKKVDVSAIKDMLLDDNFDYAKVLPLVKANADKFASKEFRETTITY
jgi:NAD(P)H-nitrite reductase large subunit